MTDNIHQLPEEEFNLDHQIKYLEEEIVKHSKNLFESQCMLRMAVHIKNNCNVTPKRRKANASRSPAR